MKNRSSRSQQRDSWAARVSGSWQARTDRYTSLQPTGSRSKSSTTAVALAGLAGARIGGEAVLFIASDNGLEAWKLEPTGETLATPGGKELE